VENMTEVNKRSNIREEMLVRNNGGLEKGKTRGKGGKEIIDHYDEVDVLTDETKRK
jgi:hypothetical protein